MTMNLRKMRRMMMGQVIAMTKCPFHGDTDPSLAIYENGFYCFGCHKSGRLEQWMTDLAHQKPVNNSSINTIKYMKDIEEYTYKYTDKAKEFLKKRKIRIDIAKECGIKNYNTKLLVPLYNMEGVTSGKQVRFLDRKPKYRLLPKIKHKQHEYPTYSRVLPDVEFGEGAFIVESVYDAARLYQATSLPSIAILGTNMRNDLIQSMYMLSRAHDTKWIIYFDPDAHVISRLIADKLMNSGLRGATIMSDSKPYEETDESLLSMVEEVL